MGKIITWNFGGIPIHVDSSEISIIMGETVEKGHENEEFSLRVSKDVNCHEKLSYTTDIETMNIIFEKMTLRSSSLTYANLNDPIEKERVGVSEFAGSRFITCFSHIDHESVPFWVNYGGNNKKRKVLLLFDNFTSKVEENIFLDYTLIDNNKKCYFNGEDYNLTVNNNGIRGIQAGMQPINTEFDTRACINNMQIFDIEYVPVNSSIFEDDNSGEITVDFGNISGQEDDKLKCQGYDPTVLGKQKSDPWDYENETRILCTLSSQRFDKWQFIDLRLKSEMFRNLTIILSPWDTGVLFKNVTNAIENCSLPQEIKDSIVVKNSGLKGKLNV